MRQPVRRVWFEVPLTALYTGRQPTKRTYATICLYFIGWATEDGLLAHLKKRKRQGS